MKNRPCSELNTVNRKHVVRAEDVSVGRLRVEVVGRQLAVGVGVLGVGGELRQVLGARREGASEDAGVGLLAFSRDVSQMVGVRSCSGGWPDSRLDGAGVGAAAAAAASPAARGAAALVGRAKAEEGAPKEFAQLGRLPDGWAARWRRASSLAALAAALAAWARARCLRLEAADCAFRRAFFWSAASFALCAPPASRPPS